MVSGPIQPRCINWYRGFKGKRSDFNPPMEDTCVPGSAAGVEGQRVDATTAERSLDRKQAAKATKGAQGEGRHGSQESPYADRMARFPGGRWSASGPSRMSAGAAIGWGHRYAQGRAGPQCPN